MELIYLFLIIGIILSITLIGIFLFALISVIFDIIWFFKTKVPFGRSNLKILREFLDNLDLKDKIFIDLGSGDGSIIFEAVKRGARGIGYEINPFLYYLSLIKSRFLGYKNITFFKEDFKKAKIEDADYIYLYLTPKILNEISDFIFNNCKNDCKIITFDFRFYNKEPIEVFKKRIFVYKK